MEMNRTVIGIILLVVALIDFVVVKYFILSRIPNPITRDILWKATLFGIMITLAIATNFIFGLSWVQ